MGELDAAKDEQTLAFTLEQSDGFIESEVRRLSKLYKLAGIPFASSLASYEELLPFLQQRIDMLSGYPEGVSCFLCLMGDEDRARLFRRGF